MNEHERVYERMDEQMISVKQMKIDVVMIRSMEEKTVMVIQQIVMHDLPVPMRVNASKTQ